MFEVRLKFIQNIRTVLKSSFTAESLYFKYSRKMFYLIRRFLHILLLYK